MIERSYFWFTTALLGFGTFLIRSSFVFLSDKIELSDRSREVLSFIPAAILPALLIPIVFFHEGDSRLFIGKERVVATIIAFGFSYWTKSMFGTIVFGLSLLFLLAQT